MIEINNNDAARKIEETLGDEERAKETEAGGTN